MKETETKENVHLLLTINISFQGQRNPQKYENRNQFISFKASDFCKLCTLNKLVICTLSFRYSLVSRDFPKVKYSLLLYG